MRADFLRAFVSAIALSAIPARAQTSESPAPPTSPAEQTPPPPEERIHQLEESQQQLQQQVIDLQQDVDALSQLATEQQEATLQGVLAAQQLAQLQNSGQSIEQTRIQRAASYDNIERQLVEMEAAMALGRTVDDLAFLQLQEDLVALQNTVEQQSGREELIYLNSALVQLNYARQIVLGGDYFVARQNLFEAIDNVVEARNSVTGNPMPVWRQSE